VTERDPTQRAYFQALDTEDPRKRVEQLIDLTAQNPDVDVKQALNDAFTATKEISYPQERVEALTTILAKLPYDSYERSDFEDRVLDEAFAAAKAIEDPPLQAEAYVKIGRNVDSPEYKEGAAWGAQSSLNRIEDPLTEGRPLGGVAQLFAQVGKLDEAEYYASRARNVAEDSGDAWLRAQMARLQKSLDEMRGDVTAVGPSGQPQPEGVSPSPPDDSVPPPRERIDIAARALADQWSEEDQLGFSDYATALADFIEDERTKKPLTIGIDAPWGMGKTTLMHMIENRLQEDRPHAPPLPTVWFNAWKHDKEESLWAALALEILRQVQEKLSLSERIALWFELNRERLNIRLLVLRFLRTLLLVLLVLLLVAAVVFAVLRTVDVQVVAKQAWRYIGIIGGLGVIATLYNTIGKDLYRRFTSPFKLKIAEYMEEPNYEEKVGYLAQFDRDFKRVISAVTDDGKRPLVIFIDDLDRSAPPKPVEIFEAINMLLDSEHCVFVLGMDGQAVAKSIEAKYKDLRDTLDDTGDEPSLGRRFLEKLVQIPLAVPRADERVFRTFISKNLEAGEQARVMEEDRGKVVQAEKLIEEEQRAGKSLDAAARAVQSRVGQTESGISEGAVREARVELRARSFGDSDEVRKAVAEAVPYLEYNPRKVKRFINLFKLQALIANRRGLIDDGTIQFERLSKWIIISTRWPAVVEAAMSDPAFINRLVEAHDTDEELRALDDEAAREQLSRSRQDPLLADPRIRVLHQADELVRLLKDLPLSGRQTLPYLYLTRVTSTNP
jgi:hypothetical protein